MEKSKNEIKEDNNDNTTTFINEKLLKVDGEIEIRKYIKGQKIGKGGFSDVYELMNIDTNKIYAAKVISKQNLIRNIAKQKLRTEIRIHRSLNCNNIVAFEHYFEDEENVYLLLELCPNSTLKQLLKTRKRLTEIEVMTYSIQIIRALKYLHINKIIHRDVKIGNMFLSDKMELKLGDFGLAAKLDNITERRRTLCGTPNYIAPEILDGKSGYSFEVDNWALGVVMYTLVIGRPPFETNTVRATYDRIKSCQYSFPEDVDISDNIRDLIQRILVKNPFQRLNLDEIQKHCFFSLVPSIPLLMPVTTLNSAPSLTYLQQFIPQLDESCKIDSSLLARIEESKSFEPRFTVYELETEKEKELSKQNIDVNIKDTSKVIVKKFIDYSSKYGIAYLLSNESVGFSFNDNTKMITFDENLYFYYIETIKQNNKRSDIIFKYSFESYPKEIHKKVSLFHYFADFLQNKHTEENFNKLIHENHKDDSTNFFEPNNNINDKENNLNPNHSIVYVVKWFKNRLSVLFKLSNKNVQVCFMDKTEIILLPKTNQITFIDKNGQKITYPYDSALLSKDPEMIKRLKFTKDLLSNLLRQNRSRKSVNTLN